MTSKKQTKKTGNKKTSKAKNPKAIPKGSGTKKKVIKSNNAKKENNILKGFFIFLILVLVLIAGIWIISQSVKYSKYKDVVEFETIQEGDLIFYKTFLSVGSSDEIENYNLFLRTKPKDLEKVSFEGVEDFNLMKLVAININPEQDFNCDGDGVIAIANLMNLHKIINSEFFMDQNATCDGTGRYNYFYVQEGEKT
ncbi:MAG: hypothetical protein U9Q99_01525, partial [Nanoarchaeota archaeon]|nr:hypothetical protein [Nanoarchaeota archaeon]